MGTSSGSDIHRQPKPSSKMLPPRQQPRPGSLQTSLSLVSSDPRLSPDNNNNNDPPRSNSENARESPAESASSRDTWPADPAASASASAKKKPENGKPDPLDLPEQSVVRRVSPADKISLRDIARERVEIISEKMAHLPEEFLEEVKNSLRVILDGNGGGTHHNREEFYILQRLVQGRPDLTAKTLIRAHRVQLEILVAINTGILAFLHPNVSLSQTSLIEIFVYKRCRNIACQNQLPAEDCTCEVCSNRNGFCNLCMCVVCNKFDFEVNTCRWIGCDLCSHWTHTDCAIRDGLISMGPSVKSSVAGPAEMLFRCRACNRTSELLGWVKDVFQHCAPAWEREPLTRELDFVSRIFHGSEDPRGQKLFWKCEELKEKLKNGVVEAPAACRSILMFFQELEVDSPKSLENGEGRLIAPQEACNRIAEVVQEAIRKMEMVADEKMRMYKKARFSVEACDRELQDKSKEVSELNLERQKKKLQIEELEKIVRLKHAEADMFQLKANEAKREAERLQRIALSKSDKSEEEYANSYLKQRLNEAEAEKQYLFEKMKLQESSRGSQSGGGGGGGESSQMMMYSKMQDLIYNATSKTDSQSSDRNPFRKSQKP